jgi:hypothetical protein
MLETVPGVWGTYYGRWENTSDSDIEVCFPKHSSFHLEDRIYLNVDGDHIELKRGMMVVKFPLIRLKMFETYGWVVEQ